MATNKQLPQQIVCFFNDPKTTLHKTRVHLKQLQYMFIWKFGGEICIRK